VNVTEVVVLLTRENVAIQVTFPAGIVNVADVAALVGQEASPDQLVKAEPDASAADSVTVAPAAYPPAPDRVPLPVPAVCTVTV
jgi:hypothetical protein